MIKKPILTRPVRQINLSLPVLQTDAYEVYYSVPRSHHRHSSTKRSIVRPKTNTDNNNNNNNNSNNNTDSKKSNNPITRLRSPGRLAHLTGPVAVNLFVEMPTIPRDSSSLMVDPISNVLNKSCHSGLSLRAATTSAIKQSKAQSTKNDEARSQSSYADRLLYESLVSFEDARAIKTKNMTLQSVHYPTLTTGKLLHTRGRSKRIVGSNAMHLRISKSFSLEHLLQESTTLSRQHLNEKIEQLTRLHFPTIQQLRRGHPSSGFNSYRTYLHREEKRDFIPVFCHSRLSP
ncbi:unnamed protein product [Rotaria socialis]|uniref:Uncharacterized protein n=2 Tax=Rotaria socialis TaxID=392032 RepID=A0A820WGF8_9BILA|nr:unnamed protein product [Rotaria socialis]CAF4516790.1 unnamed protein product [Rotaria socialis]